MQGACWKIAALAIRPRYPPTGRVWYTAVAVLRKRRAKAHNGVEGKAFQLEPVIVYGIILGGLALFFGFYFYAAHRRDVKIKARIAEEYGKPPVWALDERDYASMKKYCGQHPPQGPAIDDITWNDLNMDAVFKRVKNTQSSIGDEYSYRFFRKQHNQNLPAFEAAVQAMHNGGQARQKLQFAFHKIGRKTNNGLVDLLLEPGKFPKIPLPAIILVTLAGIASLVWMAFDIDYGILAVTLSFCASLILFGVVLRKIYGAMATLGMFTRMVRAAKLVVKLDIPQFKEQTAQLRKNLVVFKNIGALADYIVQVSGSANSLMMIFTSYFGLYGFAYQAMVHLFRKHRAEALELYKNIGHIELCISVASYRASLPGYCVPTFVQDGTVAFEDIVHPLLKKPVPNSHVIGNKILITGSNASGKSTFARTLAVNTILGQLFNTCLARQYAFRPCEVYTSMNLKDDITTGDSFYVAEVKSLKRLLEVAAAPGYPMLFMDEIFKGTNMVERIAAASVILKRFADADCFLCLATHDVELSRILGARYQNYHFREVVTQDDISFDYTLREGVTTGSNAIKMLAYCHYDADIVQQAETEAGKYRKTGEWAVL